MLCIDNIRFWCKVEGFLDRINAPQTVLRIIIDENFALPHLPGKTQKNTTNWQHQQIPPIELSPYQNSYKIQFALYREGELIGLGRTEFKFKQNRRDCLDIVDREFRVTGKLVYELNWTNGAKVGNFINYQQVTTAKNNSGGKQVVLAQKIKTQRQTKYVKKDNQEDDCSSGICACFAVRKKKKVQTPRQVQQPPKVSQRIQQIKAQQNVMTSPPLKLDSSNKQFLSTKFKNNPLVYFQQQLEHGRQNDIQQLNRLSFYSKNIGISK